MSAEKSVGSGLAGLRVASFESRRAKDMETLIRREGGEALVAPSMREVPLSDQPAAMAFGAKLMAGEVDVLILMTGVGTRLLLNVLSTRWPEAGVVAALRKPALVVRGPKPIIALRERGLAPTLTVPEPNTWRDVLQTLDTRLPVAGKRVAVQEYGASNEQLLEELAARGADVTRVPVYQWDLPEDLGPLEEAVRAVCAGKVDVLLFTSATQAEHLVRVAQSMGLLQPLREAARRCVVAAVGPVCAEAVERHGLPVDIQPAHPNMGSLISEAARRSRGLLERKRT